MVAVAGHRYVARIVPDAYAQWVSAEMVPVFRKGKGRMPSGWDGLAPGYEVPVLRHGGRSFHEIRRPMAIEFSELTQLAREHPGSRLPEVTGPVRGSRSHWKGAEPNQRVHRGLRQEAGASP